MFNRIKFLMFLLILISFSCEKKLDENNVIPEITYPYDFFMNKPDNLKEKAPLVFVLHGYTSNNNNIMNYSKMNEIADEYGFMVCYPQGTRNTYTGQTHWNANLKEMSSIADSDFLNDLAIKLQAEYNLSEKNTFACGMSNGGFMSYNLGCEKSDTFKAIASAVAAVASGADSTADAVLEDVAIAMGHVAAGIAALKGRQAVAYSASANLAAAAARIEDTDFAKETANLAKNSVLNQSAMAMVAQANQGQSAILAVLQ